MDDNPWTGLMIICLVVIVIIVICCSPASAAECRLVGKPEPTPWEPDPEDVEYIPDMCWCSGVGKHQTFRNTWMLTEETEYYP